MFDRFKESLPNDRTFSSCFFHWLSASWLLPTSGFIELWAVLADGISNTLSFLQAANEIDRNKISNKIGFLKKLCVCGWMFHRFNIWFNLISLR